MLVVWVMMISGALVGVAALAVAIARLCQAVWIWVSALWWDPVREARKRAEAQAREYERIAALGPALRRGCDAVTQASSEGWARGRSRAKIDRSRKP